MAEKTKETRIKNELKRLQAKFELVDANQREVVAQLIQNAAFLAITLQDLQAEINRAGTVDFYQNGQNQHGQKQSATLQAYNSSLKNYANVIKTLAQLVPYEKKPATTWQAPADPVKTDEEKAAEQAAKDAALAKEIRQAKEYQEYQRECRNTGARELSYTAWKAQQGSAD